MNKALLLIWEQSEIDKITPDGASLHIDIACLNNFLNSKTEKSKKVPKSYSRVVGLHSEVVITDSLYKLLETKKNLRIQEYEFNNLVQFKEIQ